MRQSYEVGVVSNASLDYTDVPIKKTPALCRWRWAKDRILGDALRIIIRMTNHVNPHPSRTAIYIDGFNLYFGLKSKGWQKYYWLDLWEFSTRLADKRKLVSVKYFTSDISGPQDAAI